MLELIGIQHIAKQGMTKPLLCVGSDGKNYYAKGKRATASGLMKEWMAGNLAKAFGLPIPPFQIAYIDDVLVQNFDNAMNYLGGGDVFVSEQVVSATDFKYQMLKNVSLTLQQDILFFDLWVENADRTLTAKFSGNPNLLWKSECNELYVIDHNLAFDAQFDVNEFRQTHVCHAQFKASQLDVFTKQTLERRLSHSLQNWWQWWDDIPDDWKQQNADSMFFNPEKTLQRLELEAQGAIWSKFL